MKYLPLFFLIIVFTYSDLKAEIGIKLGIVTTKFEKNVPLRGDPPRDTIYGETRVGPTIGVSYRYLDIGYFEFESELFYVQKGGQDSAEITTIINPQGTGETITFNTDFDYLQFQTAIRPKVEIKYLEIFGIIGISVNYLLGVRNDESARSDFRDFVFAYSIGGGVEIKDIVNSSLFIEFLYNSDISNIYNESDSEHKFKSYIFRLGVALN